MKYYGTEGIVLASRNRGEADRILTFFTKDLGKIDAIAAGMRNGHSKLRGHLGMLKRLRMIVTPGRQYWRLVDAEEIIVRENGADEKSLGSFVQLLLEAVGPNEPHAMLWEELSRLHEIKRPAEFAALKLKTLSHLGMLPALPELQRFFTLAAIEWYAGKTSGVFLENPAEYALFENGIRKILEANHMIY